MVEVDMTWKLIRYDIRLPIPR